MSQHDFDIANGTGAAVRADINGALGAIATNNSGTTEPATTFAYQWWVDDNTDTLKLRNSANSGWIDVSTTGGVGTANLGLLTTTSAASTYLALAGGTVTGALNIGTAGSVVFEGSTADAFETTLAVTDPTADRTFTLPDASTTAAGLAVTQTFTKAQRGTISALTDGATITADFAAANNFSVTLGGNRTLANPSNITAGQSGCIFISQDATGSRTLAYGTNWDFAGGTPPTLSTAANAVDLLVYTVRTTTSIQAQLIANFS